MGGLPALLLLWGVVADVHFRVATHADLPVVSRLRRKVFSPHLTSVGSAYFQERLYLDAMKNKSAVLVALDDECAIVGAADLTIQNVAVKGGKFRSCCYVANVCVDLHVRRRGVARGLMDLAKCVGRERRVCEMLLHVEPSNTAAVQLYESHGFRQGASCADVEIHFSDPSFYNRCEAPPQNLLSLQVPWNDQVASTRPRDRKHLL